MKWKRIYEHYDEWDESTIKELLLNVTGIQ